MVTRVDKKPIIYNASLIKAIRPSILGENKRTLDTILRTAVGYNIPKVAARDIIDDFEDIEYTYGMFGIDDSIGSVFSVDDDDMDDEAIRFARVCLDRNSSVRKVMRSKAYMEEMSRIQEKVFQGVTRTYFGTEAVYQVYYRVLCGNVFDTKESLNYKKWCSATAERVLIAQSTYNLIHPTASSAFAQKVTMNHDYTVWAAWDIFKKVETAMIRIGSRKNMLAHAYYAGRNKRGFDPSDNIANDFALPLTGFARVRDDVRIHLIMGVRYMRIGDCMFVLSHDDCINMSTMAQCYYRVAAYFTESNGYAKGTPARAMTLVRDITAHCCKLIDAGKNYAHIIRSMHILAQREFNDAYESDFGIELGWRDRSSNYTAEAKELDPMGEYYYRRATDLAIDSMDRLNTCFIYHAFVGDEMLISDLRSKVKNMTAKVRSADTVEWNQFILFVKAYLLCRFMMVNKKKPRCAGDISLLNSKWADRCVSGTFTMPPPGDWGRVWISGEFGYTEFANIWHLEAQDVAYVVKDSKGIVDSKYASKPEYHSELLMAVMHGSTLDLRTGSTARTARDRICRGEATSEVVLTTAPKAENAKPSWKKRVTFAADCEFRKMQAEYDRNCRRVMSFVRGPSLGVDQCILEKQFSDINDATATGTSGAICSHDISAWSESMDRGRKFEFEKILIGMFDKPQMANIDKDWAQIKAVVVKQGCKDIHRVDNGSFQGFDGSSSTILHSMILIYCIDSARRKGIMSYEVKTNMATLIDDCIALMVDLVKEVEAKEFWDHLKATYLKLGFEVDDLKSIFSNIKAIYLSRRFLLGGEVPSDLKVFIKAHSSYEDPLRCSLDIPSDIFGAMRGACDANGDPLFVYMNACISSLAEIAHSNNCILTIPPEAAAIYALAPFSENGWGFPSIISWCTNDITDKRAHFNAILELMGVHGCAPKDFQSSVNVYPKTVSKAVYSIKSQAWRMVSYGNLFTSPFEAIREGPLKPDMLKRNAIQDHLRELDTAEPWTSLLRWNTSSTTSRVREMLIQSGALHAPTLAALVNCMPDNYRLGLVGKAIGSDSLLSILPRAAKLVLKRRVNKCSAACFEYTRALYMSSNLELDAGDISCMTYIERTNLERDEFYAANGVVMVDHTFPDPVATFTVTSTRTNSLISPNRSGLRVWDKMKSTASRSNQFISDKGIYVPRRSGRVWEVTCEYAKGWDSVSQRVAMGLAILARAEADGHETGGLLSYFVKSWNEVSNITPDDTHLIAIHGSIKRLDANPGSSTHPVTVNRNILRGFNNTLRTALEAIPVECEKAAGSRSHLHDFLAHETTMTCLTGVMFNMFCHLGAVDAVCSYQIATRVGCIVPESRVKMTTNCVVDMIEIEIMDSHDTFGLLQACPQLAVEIAVPTMKSGWVRMINGLMDRDISAVEEIRLEAMSTPLEELLQALGDDETYYSPSVILAAMPAERGSYSVANTGRFVLAPTRECSRALGDDYTKAVRTVGSQFTRALNTHQPEHVIAATAVRSLVWSRMKGENTVALAKILYHDPDADYSIIKRCSSPDFWRAIVGEIAKASRSRGLSEMVMAAFRSLGVHSLHLRASESASDVCHSLASFFGANLKSVVLLISDLITSLSGRRTSDYDRPLMERIVTNNPSVMNAKFRREHMSALIKSNQDMLKERIDRMLARDIVHRGDKRAASIAWHPRLVELRCRHYVYLSVDISDGGKAVVNEDKFGTVIHNCAVKVCEKIEFDPLQLPDKADTFEGTLQYMWTVDITFQNAGIKGRSGWDAESGSIGARLAYSTIVMDSDMVMGTKFAVSASEVAPRVYKRVISTPRVIPEIAPAPEVEEDINIFDFDDDDVDLMALEGEEASELMTRGSVKLPIPYWHALYALVLMGSYTGASVNEKLGTSIGEKITPREIIDAHLEDFTYEQIKEAFPGIEADYVDLGVAFDERWLERDDTDAYTTDEINTIKGGFLF